VEYSIFIDLGPVAEQKESASQSEIGEKEGGGRNTLAYKKIHPGI